MVARQDSKVVFYFWGGGGGSLFIMAKVLCWTQYSRYGVNPWFKWSAIEGFTVYVLHFVCHSLCQLLVVHWIWNHLGLYRTNDPCDCCKWLYHPVTITNGHFSNSLICCIDKCCFSSHDIDFAAEGKTEISQSRKKRWCNSHPCSVGCLFTLLFQ